MQYCKTHDEHYVIACFRCREDRSSPGTDCSTATELALDVSAEEARALHRVVRAMHDGHCPKCGYLGPADIFWRDDKPPNTPADDGYHECPICKFRVTEVEARLALAAFKPHLAKSVEVFERWREGL